ncbi:MAG: aminotransferase class V-fold PLP-dependent enzyme [Clostridia bacterium]|nr:aminotransferase class V-fold PLP-dependent enzyme [Clostridia bacterium]
MKTPIYDFVKKYEKENNVRLHMPGHKGHSLLGIEGIDITELDGADSLYHASGIIKESEENATKLFGSGATLYSCEGSSLSVRAMCYLAMSYVGENKSPYILATRNAHSSFISASILLDFDIKWLYSRQNDTYLSCKISAEDVENAIKSVDNLPFAVYITSPDYLGSILDIQEISKVCKKYGVPLLVDNAHGAYLKFLDNKSHPIDLGADMCCDSAHKTLPVLTGGGYLHISKNAPGYFKEHAKEALSLFGSSSPSYLILSSLDKANEYIENGYSDSLNSFISELENAKKRLGVYGFTFLGDEKLKWTISTKEYGYTGTELAFELKKQGVVCEFCDPDYLVLMFTPESKADLQRTENALCKIQRKEPILKKPSILVPPTKEMSTKKATFSSKELISIDNANGRILASLNLTCPPAISVLVAGERFNESSVELCKYYGYTCAYVVKE